MHINTNNVTKFNNKTQCKNMLTEGITIITITHKSVLPTTPVVGRGSANMKRIMYRMYVNANTCYYNKFNNNDYCDIRSHANDNYH